MSSLGHGAISQLPYSSTGGAITAVYDPSTDVFRARRPIVWDNYQSYVQPRSGSLVVVTTTYVAPDYSTSIFGRAAAEVAEIVQVVKAQKGYVVNLTTYAAVYDPATDLPRRAQAKFFTEQQNWPVGQKSSHVVRTSYALNGDIRNLRPQAKVFSDYVNAPQAQRQSLVTVLTTYSTYNPATDVFRKRQAQFYQQPQVFVQTQGVVLGGDAAAPFYDPATDIRRRKQAQVFNLSEVFAQPLGVNLTTLIVPPSEDYDIALGQDTYGWPVSEQAYFKAQNAHVVFLTQYAAGYNPSIELRRRQAIFVPEYPVFVQPARSAIVTRLTTYAPGSIVWTAAGGITFSGAGGWVRGTVYPSNGGLVFSGTAPEAFRRAWVAQGGIVHDGAAGWVRKRVYPTSGGILFDGQAGWAPDYFGNSVRTWAIWARQLYKLFKNRYK